MSTAGEIHFRMRRDIRQLRAIVETLRAHAGKGVAVPMTVDDMLSLANGLDRILTQAAQLAETVALGHYCAIKPKHVPGMTGEGAA